MLYLGGGYGYGIVVCECRSRSLACNTVRHGKRFDSSRNDGQGTPNGCRDETRFMRKIVQEDILWEIQMKTNTFSTLISFGVLFVGHLLLTEKFNLGKSRAAAWSSNGASTLSPVERDAHNAHRIHLS